MVLESGNKSDAPGRAVTTEEAREKADEPRALSRDVGEERHERRGGLPDARVGALRRAPPERPQKKRL